MLDLVAKELFLTKGKGVHEDRLTSFEYALRDAGIAGTNLVLISSIFPPKAKLISRKEGLKKICVGLEHKCGPETTVRLQNICAFVTWH